MPKTIPDIEPLEFAVGETVQWNKSLTEFPASAGWVLTYAIRGKEALDVTATSTGDQFNIAITAAQSGTLVAGDYVWESRVALGAAVHVVDSGLFKVDASIYDQGAGYEGRSIARQCLEKLHARALNRASRDDLNFSLPGTGMTVGKLNATEFIVWYDYFKNLVALEDQKEKAKRGENTGKNVLITFPKT